MKANFEYLCIFVWRRFLRKLSNSQYWGGWWCHQASAVHQPAMQNPAKQSIAMQNPAKQSKVQNKPVVVFHCLLETIHWHEKVLEKLLKWIGVLRHWGERRNLIMYLSLGHHICSILTPRLVVCVVYRIMQVLQFLHTVQICMNLVELWKLCVYNLVRIDKSMNTAAERTS